jgi:hypothetical protein
VLLPNHAEAIIPPAELRDYLLVLEHKDGGPKARRLVRIGFRREAWEELEVAIRKLIGESDAVEVFGRSGRRFQVEGILEGPAGTTPFRTVWVMDGDTPFLASAYPRDR